MTWERGRADVEHLLASGYLEVVTPAPGTADRLLADSQAHLGSARHVADDDPTGAYQLAYDAARKAVTALLAAQGLRPTSRGGHVTVQDAARCQFGGDGGHRAFDRIGRLRRRRNDIEYPMPDSPTITPEDVSECIEGADEILQTARRLLASAQLTPFQHSR